MLFGIGVSLWFIPRGGPPASAPLPCPPLRWRRSNRVAATIARRVSMIGGPVAPRGSRLRGGGFARAGALPGDVDAPALVAPASGTVEGFVESLDTRPNGLRIVLRVVAHDLPTRGEGTLRVRATLRGDASVAPGDWMVARVRLLPPPQAVRPGGYDFAKEAYFRGIGAVGSIVGRPRIGPPPVPPDLGLATAARLDAQRNAATLRIAEAVGGQPGAVAAALVTGKRGLIAEETNEALRAAGVYHIVSISGLHMVLATGTVFFGLRALLAAFPVLALRWPIKKIAAAAAILGGAAYCVFSGSAVATERALIMTTIMFGAILVDRPALSMRNLALAALIVLAREPEALVGPSFQMSFSAVAGLIAGAEWQASRARPPGPQPGRIGRALGWARGVVVGIVGTTIIRERWRRPFAAFHFQTGQPLRRPWGMCWPWPLVTFTSLMPAAVLGSIAPAACPGRRALQWMTMARAWRKVIASRKAVPALAGLADRVAAFGWARSPASSPGC